MGNLNLKEIRDGLENEHATLVTDIQNEQNKLHIYAEANPDPLDLADKRLHQEIIIHRLSQMEQRLQQAKAALKRLDEGTYGICVKCGKAIHPKRLEAMPYAALCVYCQKRFEGVE
jgi:DnaK suppressor protein